MFTQFKVDQVATFAGVAFLSSEPKRKFGSDVQETTKDGVLRWEVQVIAMFRTSFGKMQNEVLKIGVAAPRNPGQGLLPYTPVALKDFEVGVMEKTKRLESGEEKVIGLQVWYRAAGIQAHTETKAA